jgi:hypothetical protein
MSEFDMLGSFVPRIVVENKENDEDRSSWAQSASHLGLTA